MVSIFLLQTCLLCSEDMQCVHLADKHSDFLSVFLSFLFFRGGWVKLVPEIRGGPLQMLIAATRGASFPSVIGKGSRKAGKKGWRAVLAVGLYSCW